MTEKEFKDYKNQKCLERTTYRSTQRYSTLPVCAYYDVENNKCKLNACIKNMKGAEK